MKIVKIEHIQCNEHQGYTYILAPEHLSITNIREDVYKARNAYLKHLKSLPTYPGYPNISLLDVWPDDITVREAKKLLVERKKEQKEYQIALESARRSFGSFLLDAGYQLLSEQDSDIELDWGHNHKLAINLSSIECDVELRSKEDSNGSL